MYKLLLCLRYLRTRWIALASVVSVTLGVATLIVVNSVMGGFATEMRDRVRGVLADIMIEGGGFNGFDGVAWLMEQINQSVGSKVEAMTPVVETFGLLNFNVMGRTYTQPVHVVAIDPQGRAAVSRFAEYLLDPRNQQHPSFEIREDVRESMEPWRMRRQSPLERTTEESSQNSPLRHEEGRSEDQTTENESATNHESAIPHAGPLVQAEKLQRSANYQTGVGSSSQPSLVRLGLPYVHTVTGSEAVEGESGPPRHDRPTRSKTGSEDSDTPVRQTPSTDLTRPSSQPSDSEINFEETPQTPDRGIIVPWLLASYRSNGTDHEVIRPGDQVLLTLAGTAISALRPEGRLVQFTVVDRFKSGMSEYDQSQCYVSIKDLQDVRGMGDRVTGIHIKLKDYKEARDVVTRLEKIFHPPLFRVLTWEEKQGPLLAAVAVEQGILNVLLFMIIAVAGFGILAIFFMIVVEKTRDIGILKSLGASDRGVLGIFLGYGLSLGMVGSGLGMCIGLLITIYLDNIEKFLSRISGRELFSRDLYYFDKIPTVINPVNIGWIVSGALLIALAASVLPARRAAALRPVEALRYE